jgi:hypothetical protein
MSHRVYFQSQPVNDSSLATFSLVVQNGDLITNLSYADQFALQTKGSCDIKESLNGNCAAQNLPLPYSPVPSLSSPSSSFSSSSSSLSFDGLSPVGFSISQNPAVVTNVQFQYTVVSLGIDNNARGNVWGVPLVSASSPFPLVPGVETPMIMPGYKRPEKEGKRTNSTVSSVKFDTCDPYGASWLYQETVDVSGGKRIITTTTCPNHFSVCQTQKCAIEGTLSVIMPQKAIYEVPLYPVIAFPDYVTKLVTSAGVPANLSCETGNLGIALNGVGIGGRSDGTAACNDVIQSNATAFDKCGGLSNPLDGSYRYHIAPSCLLHQLGFNNEKNNNYNATTTAMSLPSLGLINCAYSGLPCR